MGDLTYIAGHRGLVGTALVQTFASAGCPLVLRTHAELDLTDQGAVRRFFDEQRPKRVVVAAAKVGGILANNTQRADFIYQNLMIAANVVDAAHRTGVEKLLFLGSNCNYPRECPQPMKEEHLLTGPLEPTNEPYAIAKIAGIKLAESYHRQYGRNFFSAMPANLYGPHDNFDLRSCHLLPALIRRFHEAKVGGNVPVTLWGTGTPRRECMHAEDLASACLFLLDRVDASQLPGGLVNIGCGQDHSIAQLALAVQRIVGHTGEILWDSSKPDGAPQKLFDDSLLKTLGWQPSISLKDGLELTYRWYLHAENIRGLT